MIQLRPFQGDAISAVNSDPMIGMTFGLLTVATPAGRKSGAITYLCDCACGGKATRAGRDLRSVVKRGCVPGCGCTASSAKSINGKANRTHGLSNTKLYGVWRQMHQRCENPACKDYPMWGGRGISVCTQWDDIHAFKAWAECSGYADGVTIERVDNSAGYSPSNCRWVPNALQAKNTRRQRMVTIGGAIMDLSDLARESGINYSTLRGRANRGLTGDRLIEPPAK